MNLGQDAFCQALYNLAKHDHLCLIYETREEQFAAIVPFMRFGLERGERCLYIADDNTACAVLDALRAGGIDTDAALASGALAIAAKQDAYLKRGYFDPDWMIEFLAQATAEAHAAGFTALRVTGEMTWMLGGDPGVERLIEYEAKLNFFFPEHDALAICQYNRHRFSPSLILDVIRTHPLVIYGGWVCRNPYYIPPDEMLSGKEDDRAVERMLASLREREREIAERRRAEEALRKSKELFEKTFASQRDAIFILDAQIPPLILDCNPAATEMFGYARHEMIGRTTAFLHVNEETLREFQRCLYPAIEEQGFLQLPEFAMKRKDGTIFPSEHSVIPLKDQQGLRIGWVSVIRDITERVQARTKLEQQNQRLQALREIDTAILAADSVENIIDAALGRVCKLIDCQCAFVALMDQDMHTAQVFSVDLENGETRSTRTPALDAIDHPLRRILSHDRPILIEEAGASSESLSFLPAPAGKGLHSLCLLPLRAHGDLLGAFGMASSVLNYFDEEKVAVGREVANQIAIAIAQNILINALRQLNVELEARVAERTAQLEAINKELEAFSYSVSHDLRAPLRIIDGFSNALANRHWNALDNEGRNYLTRIRENTRRMRQLIDDLLALSRITRQEMRWERVDLSRMARTIADELHAQAPERRIEFEIEEQLETWGDAGLLRIALYNLLDNACKFTSGREQARIRFGKLGNENETVFFVRDNGVGFDMAYADKLFGAFQRLHTANEFPGTGIGLATVQRIIHRHGGKIWAEAEVDKGATFYFTLRDRP